MVKEMKSGFFRISGFLDLEWRTCAQIGWTKEHKVSTRLGKPLTGFVSFLKIGSSL